MTQPSEQPLRRRQGTAAVGATGRPTALGALRDRGLHLARPTGTHSKVDPEFDPPASGGIALCGERAGVGLLTLKASADVLVLADAAVYESYIATAQSPLRVPDISGTLFAEDDPLDSLLNDLTAAQAPFAFTPSGYIAPGDFAAFKALVSALAGIARADVVAVVPMAVTWLRKETLGQVIACLRQIPHPIALVLGGQYNPTDHYADIAGNLRRLYQELPNVGLWRTDVVSGLDCMANGGLFAGIGSSSALRHCVPPGEITQPGGVRLKPSVFMADLLSYTRADKLARLYANADPPLCWCTECRGRGIDRFDSFDGEVAQSAAAHNTAAWIELWSEMYATPQAERSRKWASGVQKAVDQHWLESERIEQPQAFVPSKTLTRLAKLAAADSAVQD